MEITHFLFCFFSVFFPVFSRYFFPCFFFPLFFSPVFFLPFFSSRPPPGNGNSTRISSNLRCSMQCSPHSSHLSRHCKRDNTPGPDDICVPSPRMPAKFRGGGLRWFFHVSGSNSPQSRQNFFLPESPIQCLRWTPRSTILPIYVFPGYNMLSMLPNIGDVLNGMVSSSRKCHLFAFPRSIEPKIQSGLSCILTALWITKLF